MNLRTTNTTYELNKAGVLALILFVNNTILKNTYQYLTKY